jgi:hypothetical protein
MISLYQLLVFCLVQGSSLGTPPEKLLMFPVILSVDRISPAQPWLNNQVLQVAVTRQVEQTLQLKDLRVVQEITCEDFIKASSRATTVNIERPALPEMLTHAQLSDCRYALWMRLTFKDKTTVGVGLNTHTVCRVEVVIADTARGEVSYHPQPFEVDSRNCPPLLEEIALYDKGFLPKPRTLEKARERAAHHGIQKVLDGWKQANDITAGIPAVFFIKKTGLCR